MIKSILLIDKKAMKNKVEFDNTEIVFYSPVNDVITRDKSFKLKTAEVLLIAIVSAPLDDYNQYLLFVTNKKTKHYFTLDYNLDNISEFVLYLNNKYNINIYNELVDLNDDNRIIYPAHLRNKKLYCNDLFTKLKKAVLMINPADGKLCPELFAE